MLAPKPNKFVIFNFYSYSAISPLQLNVIQD